GRDQLSRDRLPAGDQHGKRWCVSLHERAVQWIPPGGDGARIWLVHAGRGRAFERARRSTDWPEGRNGGNQHHGRSEWWRPAGKRSQLSYRRGHVVDRPDAPGKPIVFGEFAGDAGDARGSGGLERLVSRAGRPRGEFFLRGWSAHHGSAKQGFLEPDSLGLDSVSRSR